MANFHRELGALDSIHHYVPSMREETMSKTLPEWLSELERLDKEATPGPWPLTSLPVSDERHITVDTFWSYECGSVSDLSNFKGHHEEHNVRFSSAARTELPRAVEVIRCLWRNMEFQFGEDEDRVTAEIEKILNGV